MPRGMRPCIRELLQWYPIPSVVLKTRSIWKSKMQKFQKMFSSLLCSGSYSPTRRAWPPRNRPHEWKDRHLYWCQIDKSLLRILWIYSPVQKSPAGVPDSSETTYRWRSPANRTRWWISWIFWMTPCHIKGYRSVSRSGKQTTADTEWENIRKTGSGRLTGSVPACRISESTDVPPEEKRIHKSARIPDISGVQILVYLICSAETCDNPSLFLST